jgi:thiaminase/transcriptional activator TenA
MTPFSDAAWHRTELLRRAIHTLPFNTELAAGTLSLDRFRGYIIQDTLFLAEYSRALAIAGAKSPGGEVLNTFVKSAIEAVSVEQALHARYLGDYGVRASDMAAAVQSPDCRAYTSFLLATAYHDPWEVLVAALLPCFWIYWDVGCAIVKKAAPGNRFSAWIETYADDAFGDVVKEVIAITDDAAAAATPGLQARMLTAFILSSQYEWLFWDGAYQQRGWPVPG